MSIFDNLSASLGRAVGRFVRSYNENSKVQSQRIIGAWAESARWNGVDLGDEESTQLRSIRSGWVYDAINMISGEVSASESEIVRNIPGKEPIVVPNHPLDYVLNRPNRYMGKAFFWRYLTWWIELDGNAYIFIVSDEKGGIKELWPLPANMTEPMVGEDGKFISYYEFTAGGKVFDIPTEYICHIRLPNPFDIFRGLAPLTAAALAIDGDLAMSRWNANFFSRDNVMPSSVINLKSGNPEFDIDPADVDAIKEELETEYAAYRRKTLITHSPGGVDVNLLGWSARDMDFLAGRQFSKEEIYNIYGIPPGMKDKNATEANAETADRTFKEKTIWPLLVLIAEQITAQIVIVWYSEDYGLRFVDMRPSNRSMELQELNASKGALTVDEVRARYYKAPPLGDERGKELFGVTPQVGQIELTGESPSYLPAALPPTEPVAPTAPATGAQTSTASIKSVHNGVMIALFVPSRTAPFLAVGADPLPIGADIISPEELHLTMIYLGNISSGLRKDELIAVVRDFATKQSIISGKIGGIGLFGDTGDKPALYASFDSIGLSEIRSYLVGELQRRGLVSAQTHDFTPHITLAYLPVGFEFIPALDPSGLKIDFGFITLAWGDERYPFPLCEPISDDKACSGKPKDDDEEDKACSGKPKDEDDEEDKACHKKPKDKDEEDNKKALAAYELELRRWREKAIKAFKTGKEFFLFRSEILPLYVMDAVQDGLEDVKSIDDIKALFVDAMNLCTQVHRYDDFTESPDEEDSFVGAPKKSDHIGELVINLEKALEALENPDEQQ